MHEPIICHAAGTRSGLIEREYSGADLSGHNRKWPGQPIEIADHACQPRAGFFSARRRRASNDILRNRKSSVQGVIAKQDVDKD